MCIYTKIDTFVYFNGLVQGKICRIHPYEGFHKWGDPPNGRFIMENSILK